MSATYIDEWERGADTMSATYIDEWEIARAWPLLLAVAKAAHEHDERPQESVFFTVRNALRALDAAHPGWREWAP